MNLNSIASLINLLNIKRVGPQKVRSLVSAHKNPAEVFSLSTREICAVNGVDLKTARAIRKVVHFDFGPAEVEKAEKLGVELITFWDNEYPFLLRKMYDPPVILYRKGQPLKKKEDCIAMVGSRITTPYGRKVAQNLAGDLIKYGITIVSGLARGIDSISHKQTVDSRGRTIAVLGSGVDVLYPPENKVLAEKIEENGTIISEFSLGTKPNAGNFPKRNRIISGLAHGTVVIEAGDKSGAILTALNAVDQNREVFSVPGRIFDKQSLGCLRLIRNGAIPVQNARQILSHIENRLFKTLRPRQKNISLDLSREEKIVVSKLHHEPIHIDDLVSNTGMELTHMLTLLLELELKGVVQQLSGKQFVLGV